MKRNQVQFKIHMVAATKLAGIWEIRGFRFCFIPKSLNPRKTKNHILF